jgi:hypothetical protein
MCSCLVYLCVCARLSIHHTLPHSHTHSHSAMCSKKIGEKEALIASLKRENAELRGNLDKSATTQHDARAGLTELHEIIRVLERKHHAKDAELQQLLASNPVR